MTDQEDFFIQLVAEMDALKEHQKVLTACISLLADHGDDVKGSKELFAKARSLVGMKAMLDRGEPK